MEKVSGGYTIWARQTLSSEVFYNKPDKWFKIWFFLVNYVNHTDNKYFPRGSNFVSYSLIQEKTKATKAQCDMFMRWSKECGMLTTQKTTRGMIVKVEKYWLYQDPTVYETTRETIQKRHRNDTINKNDKNEKNNTPVGKANMDSSLAVNANTKVKKNNKELDYKLNSKSMDEEYKIEVDESCDNYKPSPWGKREKKTPRNKEALTLQHKYLKLLTKEAGFPVIGKTADYLRLLEAQNHLTKEEMDNIVEDALASGLAHKRAYSIAAIFSTHEINKFKSQNV